MMVVLMGDEVHIPMCCSECGAFVHELGKFPTCKFTGEKVQWSRFDEEIHRMRKCPYTGLEDDVMGVEAE